MRSCTPMEALKIGEEGCNQGRENLFPPLDSEDKASRKGIANPLWTLT